MSRFDLPLDQLRRYTPAEAAPDDFDRFWAETVAASRGVAHDPQAVPVPGPLATVEVYDLSFSGFAGDPVRAWYLRPAGDPGELPAVVEFAGYGGGRGLPHERLAWASAGYAYIVMDTRAQGAAGGVTADPHGTGPSVPGFMTRGIESIDGYYYRRVIADAVGCLDAAVSLPGVDSGQVAVKGTSQGGGIALAVAGLRHDIAAALIDVPFLCHFSRAVGLTDRDPYAEIVRYLAAHRAAAADVFRTLSYIDGIHFAARATAPALFSVALHDATCPPSTVFAAFNRYSADSKEITVYPFNDHEGGGVARWPVQVDWLTARLRSGLDSPSVRCVG